jgi:hypothetical protein
MSFLWWKNNISLQKEIVVYIFITFLFGFTTAAIYYFDLDKDINFLLINISWFYI